VIAVLVEPRNRYGYGPPFDGSWFSGMGGEQACGVGCAPSSVRGSEAATKEVAPSFSQRRRSISKREERS